MASFVRLLPNILTGSRIFFAAGFLLLLIWAQHQVPLSRGDVTKLDWSFVLFVIAGVTDILDGPLARRLKVTGKFGRSFDPFVDKILIGGGFIVLAIIGAELTGIHWWMVAVILAREVWVTVIRSVSESQGIQFAATWAGKLKMFLQSFTIGTVLIYLGHHQQETWAVWFRDITVWIAVVFTAISALIYLPRMRKLFRHE